MRSTAWASLAVAAATVLVVTVPGGPRPGSETAAPGPVVQPVTGTDLACPPGPAGAALKVAAVDGLPEPVVSNKEVEVSLDQHPSEQRVLAFGRGAVEVVDAGAEGTVLRGAGPAAPGLLAVQGERKGGTLAAAPCLAPRSTWWFAGAGGRVEHSSVLFLSNVDPGPAVVDVHVHGATGQVDEARTRGLTVGPGEVLRVRVAEVAPGSGEVALEVTAGQGRVVAQVLDTVRVPGAQGREWLPSGAPPATDVVLPGVPRGADRVELLVTNPGDEQALVRLQVVTERGAFVPLGTEALSVGPDRTKNVDLTQEVRGRAVAVRITSEVPVTGAVRSVVGGDHTSAGAAAALDEAAGVLLVGDATELDLVGGEDALTVQLRAFDAEGHPVLRRGVSAPASGLVRVPLPGRAAYVVVLPGSGDGFAAAVHQGPGTAAQPPTPLPTTDVRPVVRVYTGQSPS